MSTVTAGPETVSGDQRRIVNRLGRAHGQLAAVITAIEAGGDCDDVVTQLSAVSGALDKAGFALISSAMRECFTDPAGGSEAVSKKRTLSLDEVRKLFLMLA